MQLHVQRWISKSCIMDVTLPPFSLFFSRVCSGTSRQNNIKLKRIIIMKNEDGTLSPEFDNTDLYLV